MSSTFLSQFYILLHYYINWKGKEGFFNILAFLARENIGSKPYEHTNPLNNNFHRFTHSMSGTHFTGVYIFVNSCDNRGFVKAVSGSLM